MAQLDPIPTPGQKMASHIIVALVAGAVVHVVVSSITDLSLEDRLAISTLSALAITFAHDYYDAPVAQYIALKAA